MNERFAIGLYDDLDNQTQPLLKLDLTAGNTAVFGTHMSGKTTFLKTLLVRMHVHTDTLHPKRIYILDFGGNIGEYGKLGQIVACFTPSNEENVRRVFKAIESETEKNVRLLNARQFASVYGTGEVPELQQIVFILDNVHTFLTDERFESYQDKLLDFCRNGLSKGLSVVMTFADTGSGAGKFLRSCSSKIAFDMPDEAMTDIFGGRTPEIMKNAGRGVTDVNGKLREFQCFMPFRDEEKELPVLIRDTAALQHDVMKAFGDTLNRANAAEYAAGPLPDDPDSILVGLEYYEHIPVSVDLKRMHTIAIYGKKGFGKTNLLRILVSELLRKHPDARFVMLDDGRKQLADIAAGLRSQGAEVVLHEKLAGFTEHLVEKGYLVKVNSSIPGRAPVLSFSPESVSEPTVFVLQGKQLFQGDGRTMIQRFSQASADMEDKPVWFLYTDVRRLGADDQGVETALHNALSAAFLLDNIAEFVSERGSRSIFGNMDVKELKREYARCELGDGYFYDVEADLLRKLRFLKAGDASLPEN